MSYDPKRPTVAGCMSVMKPACATLITGVVQAPLSDADKAALSLLVAVYFVGSAMAFHTKVHPTTRRAADLARDLMNEIVAQLGDDEVPRVHPDVGHG